MSVLKIERNLSCIKFKSLKNVRPSGLNGQALEVEMTDVPSMPEIVRVVPQHCFTRQTKTSLAYLCQTLFIQGIVILIGFSTKIFLIPILFNC